MQYNPSPFAAAILILYDERRRLKGSSQGFSAKGSCVGRRMSKDICYHDCRWLYRRRRSRSGSIRRYTNANTFRSGLEAMRLTAPDMALHCMCSPSQSEGHTTKCKKSTSKTFPEKILRKSTKISMSVFPRLFLFYCVFRCYLAMGVQKH
jgi:hypothetical protein